MFCFYFLIDVAKDLNLFPRQVCNMLRVILEHHGGWGKLFYSVANVDVLRGLVPSASELKPPTCAEEGIGPIKGFNARSWQFDSGLLLRTALERTSGGQRRTTTTNAATTSTNAASRSPALP